MLRAARRAAFFCIVCSLLYAPTVTRAAVLYVDSSAETYGLGDTFVALVRVNNENECLNAAHVEVTYPTDTLRAVDFGRGSSLFTLWVEEPEIDADNGTVTFSGGVPGGYCGRIPGDPVLTNVLGKIVFTVINADKSDASISLSSQSNVYLSDGRGTEASVERDNLELGILPTPTLAENEWLSEVQLDTVPPDPFVIHVESTRGVFGGRYYIVFSTVDKQSGLDHFELFERGAWRPITSPYQLKDQFLPDVIQVRAIDKAGNERLGEYNKDDAPPRQFSLTDTLPLIVLIGGVLITLVILGFVTMYINRRKEGGAGARDTYDTR